VFYWLVPRALKDVVRGNTMGLAILVHNSLEGVMEKEPIIYDHQAGVRGVVGWFEKLCLPRGVMGVAIHHCGNKIMVGDSHLNVGVYDPHATYFRGGQNVGRVYQIQEAIEHLDSPPPESRGELEGSEEKKEGLEHKPLKIICADTNADADTSPEMKWWVTPVFFIFWMKNYGCCL